MKKGFFRCFTKISIIVLCMAVLTTGFGLGSITAFAAPSPLLLTVMYDSSNNLSTVKLTWSDTLSNESGYKIERTDLTDSSGNQSYSTSANQTVYYDSVQAGHTYNYKVYSWTTWGTFVDHTDNVTVNLAQLSPPTSLTLTQVSSTQVSLAWTYPTNLNNQTVIERRTNSGNWSTVAYVDKGVNQYTDSGLSATTAYFYRVKAIIGSTVETQTYPNDNTGQAVYITPNVPANTYTSTSPLLLTVQYDSSNNPTSVKLTWSDTLSSESGYKIERTDLTNSSGSQSLYASANQTVYYDSVQAGHMYTYKVYSWSTWGNYNVHTDDVTVNLAQISPPTGLTLTQVSATQINLAWTYPTNLNSETVIERRINGGIWNVIAHVDKGINQYSDTGLSANVVYYYRVKAVIGSTIETQTYPNDNTGQAAYAMLNAPSNLSGYAVSTAQVYLEWTDNSDETYFEVERKEGSTGQYLKIKELPANTVYWTDADPTLKANTTYYYHVYGITSAGNKSDYSNEFVVRTTYLQAPSNLSAKSNPASEVELAWTDNTSEETGFEVWRKKSGTTEWENYASVGRNVNTYIDRGVTDGGTYTYRVRAKIGHNNTYSAFSVTASAWVMVLNPPTNLSYTVPSANIISLTWTDNSNGESGFIVERREGLDGTWSQRGNLPANLTTFIDSGLSPDKQYFYRIKAYENVYYNTYVYSDEMVINSGVPQAPTNLTVDAVSSSQIRITWTDNSNNEDGFKIERRPYYTDTVESVIQVGPGVTSYVDHDLWQSMKYCYKVRAYTRLSDSAPTNEMSISTKKEIQFTDVPHSYWAWNQVTNMTSRGVFKLQANNLFKPEERITRGEFISVLVKTFNLNKTAAGSLTDVKANTKYYREIMSAYKLGIIVPDKRNYFYPNNTLTRRDAVVFLTKALRASDLALPAHDVSILEAFRDASSVAKEDQKIFASVIGEKVLEGKTIDGELLIAPNNPVIRVDAAVLLYNSLKYIDK